MKRTATPIAALAAVLVTLCAVAVRAGGVAYWRAFLRGDVVPAPDATALVIAGGDGASIPPATPAEQGLDADALAAARATAQRLGASAFAVARRGHVVLAWSGRGAEALVRSALLSRLVLAAAEALPGNAVPGDAGVLAWSLAQSSAGSLRDPWSARSRMRYGQMRVPPAIDASAWASRLSLELWRPLHAGQARVERDPNGAPRLHCCIWLRPRDALALATALTGGGWIEGERLMEAAAAERALQAMDDGVTPRGAEPFGARPARLWRDDEGTRLYSFPAQELVILLVRADEARLADETQIAHQVLRGIVDRSASPAAPATRELVPAH